MTKDEEKFIEHTGYLFDWDACEGLMGPSPDFDWILKEHLIEREGSRDKAIAKAIQLIEVEDYTALPF